MPRGVRLSMPDVDPILDRSERNLVDRALGWLRGRSPRDSAVLWAEVKRVALLGEVLDQTPSPRLPWSLGAVVRDETSLVRELAQLDAMGGELPLPEKAHIARAFLMSKIALLQNFQTALCDAAPGAEADLCREVRGEVAQSIYTLIATEILIGLLSDAEVPGATKAHAAQQLLLIWDRAAQLEIDDFCPLLEAAWKARSRAAVHFGALLGCGELMRLANEDCPSEFLDFFVRDDVSEAELAAFEEFLFNLPHEDLVKLRAAMKRDDQRVVDVGAAARLLGRPVDESAAVDDPAALYRSYRRRRTSAEFRRLTGAPGPLRTAEAYIMMYVLDGAVH